MTVLPNGYLTIHEAAEVLSQTLYAGVPDRPLVSQLHKEHPDVRDGRATERAIEEIWKAADEGKLRVLAVGGRPRRIVRLNPELTKSVPALRSPRGGGFTLLRQSNPTYHELAKEFDTLLPEVILAFREPEIQKLARRLMRARRISQKLGGQAKRRGRPSRVAIVQPVIRDLVARQKWNATMSVKVLTRAVNRAENWPKPMSQDTVTRALDLLHDQTKDRRYDRVCHMRRPRRKTS